MKSVYCEYPGLFYCEKPKYNVDNFDVANHIHTHYELAVCSSGNIIVDSSNLHVMMSAPCVMLHRPYTVHLVNSDRVVPYARQILYFDSEFMSCVDKRIADPDRVFTAGFRGIPLTPVGLSRLLSLMKPMPDPANAHLRLPLLIAMLREIERIAPENEVSGNGGLYIGEVMRYINENLSEPLDSKSIADHFFISRTKLDRDFRFYTQTTVRKYMTLGRLKNSLRLIRSGMTVADAASRSGFGDVSHYIRIFRQVYGDTPARYVKNFRQDTILQISYSEPSKDLQ